MQARKHTLIAMIFPCEASCKVEAAVWYSQMEAHSIFSRAAIQRLSITHYPPLSRGGSSSLLNLLEAEADERSVRRGQLAPAIERNYQSAHSVPAC